VVGVCGLTCELQWLEWVGWLVSGFWLVSCRGSAVAKQKLHVLMVS
jgi:hypothetical protein